MTKWHWIVGIVCLLFIAYFGYIGYLETRVNTPFDAKKVSMERTEEIIHIVHACKQLSF